MTVRELRQQIRAALLAGGVEAADFEAKALTAHLCGSDLSALPLCYGEEAPAKAVRRAAELTARRTAGEPLQYLCGEWDFYGRTFTCRENVLIPRDDTEVLAEAGIAALKKHPGPLLDLCCGSGILAVTLALETGCPADAADISADCRALTRENAARHNAKVRVLRRSALSRVPYPAGYALIVCNPPYIPSADVDELSAEVRHEPRLALDGGKDGLRFYRAVTPRAFDALLSGGTLAYEIGIGQNRDVVALLDNAGFTGIRVVKDLAGIDRVVQGKKP